MCAHVALHTAARDRSTAALSGMKHIASVVLLAALSSGCRADGHGATMAVLPANVREALLALCAPCEFADYDAQWNSTDIVLDRTPQRHLRRIEHTGASWLIEYDHGGRGLHTHTVVFELEPSVHVGRGSSCNPATVTRCEW
jgi:hypothetical protein